MTITYGSVCSGIEAATVAWHPLGMQPEWFAEIEPFPRAVLAHHWPDVPNLGDMTALARKVLLEQIPAPEVLVGGTPCQAFSVAGMRNGLADPRGALTIKYVELADAVDHVRTARGDDECVVVWENVPGVLSDKGNAFGCFLGALVGESDALLPAGGKWTDAGCVYGPRRAAAWRVLDAQYFGLAQRRRRVFVVASAREGFDPAAVLFEQQGVRRDHPPRRSSPQDAPAGTLRSTDGGIDVDHVRAGHIVGPLTAGCGPNGHGGSGLATDKGAEAGHILAFGGNNQAGAIDVATARNACASASGRMDFESETFVVHGTQDPSVNFGLAHALGRNSGQENAVFDPNQITRPDNRSNPTPGLCHTLPARTSAPIAFSCKDYGADAGELAPTLRAMGHGESHANAGGQVAVVSPTLRAGNQRNNSNPVTEADMLVGSSQAVRRLTPRECERLQGFEDDHTLIPWRGKPAEECPDGPRYKAIGNSKAVLVIRWIGIRLKRQLERSP